MPEPENDKLEALKQRLREFAEARDWDQFHSPKNLSMALITEAAELVEHLMYMDVRMPWAQDAQERPGG